MRAIPIIDTTAGATIGAYSANTTIVIPVAGLTCLNLLFVSSSFAGTLAFEIEYQWPAFPSTEHDTIALKDLKTGGYLTSVSSFGVATMLQLDVPPMATSLKITLTRSAGSLNLMKWVR